MEIIFLILIFCMGTMFGSFFTLAIYRIPLGKDITHERSFCPNCNHRLEFIDLIPIISYLSLKGKCRYCSQKIRLRYLFLEVLSGIVFLVSFLSFNIIEFPNIIFERLIAFIFFVFFYVTLVIILGIDKEYFMINKKVLLFGIITNFIYILYLYISKANVDMYRYGMYLSIMLIIFILDTILLKKRAKRMYFLEILMLLDYILIYVNSIQIFPIIILGLIFVFIYYLYKKLKSLKKSSANILANEENLRVPYGFCFSISAIIIIIINNFAIF